ncbi:hypothetical protein KCF3NO3_33590 [Chryseobacterium sp. KCF3-3]
MIVIKDNYYFRIFIDELKVVVDVWIVKTVTNNQYFFSGNAIGCKRMENFQKRTRIDSSQFIIT